MPKIQIAQEPAADELLSTDSFALLTGMLLDQQFPMERAFAGPAKIRDRFGTMDPVEIADAETAASLRACAAWLRTMFAIIPLTDGARVDDEHALGHEISQRANVFGDPYRVPESNFGWSALDACYAYASFVLDDDEALVVTHRPPACRFWNLVVWNQFMGGHIVTDARVSVNGHTAVPNADGSVTIVISQRPTAHPNAVSTVDYPRGNLAFRWFHADHVPARPDTRLVRRADAPTGVS